MKVGVLNAHQPRLPWGGFALLVQGQGTVDTIWSRHFGMFEAQSANQVMRSVFFIF